MARWKVDPLYRLILAEIASLWAEIEGDHRPDALRVEEHASADWDHPAIMGPLTDVWMLDDHGFRLASVLRREDHVAGPVRGDYYQFGLVRFHLDRIGKHAALSFQLGPQLAGELVYEIEGDGAEATLSATWGAPSESH